MRILGFIISLFIFSSGLALVLKAAHIAGYYDEEEMLSLIFGVPMAILGALLAGLLLYRIMKERQA